MTGQGEYVAYISSGAPTPHAFWDPQVPRTQERGLIGETCDQRRIISWCDLMCSYLDILTEKLS